MSDRPPVVQSDFLVIGSGIAGLTFARRAADHGRVTVITKKSDTESNTNYAQGGLASALGDDDSAELHIQDTLSCGAGLCNDEAVRICATEGPHLVRELVALGVEFNVERHPPNLDRLALGLEGGHSRRRIVHARDRTGSAIEKALVSASRRDWEIAIFEDNHAIDLLMDSGRCLGCRAYDDSAGIVRDYLARVTLLATGGFGFIYRFSTNPSIATGDGVAMAIRAGCSLAGMEFVQFHPTMLYHRGEKSFLISEAVRGEGGVLRLRDGTAFMEKYDSRKELAPRDIVARAIHAELSRTGDPCAFLDCTHFRPGFFEERFPTIHSTLARCGINPDVEPIPVVPAAHYACGGVVTDTWGQTEIPGLFAAGEVAYTGVHGANRLASNSLLEALVFGHRAALKGVEVAQNLPLPASVSLPPAPRGDVNDDGWCLDTFNEVRRLMTKNVGIVRDAAHLRAAGVRLQEIHQQSAERFASEFPTVILIETVNAALVGRLVVAAALWREESRGLHFRSDFPETDDAHWLVQSSVQLTTNGGLVCGPLV